MRVCEFDLVFQRNEFFEILVESRVLDHETSSTWADHESLVVDPMFGIVRIAAENAEDAWKELWSRMQRQFSVK